VVNAKFIDLVVERFKINANPDLKEVLIKSARIFPSVLKFLLLGDNSSYQHFPIRRFQNHPEKKNIENIVVSTFFDRIYQDMIYDLVNAQSSYLSSKEILGFSHSFEIKFGSELKFLFGIGGKLNHYIANKKIGEEIRAGEILSPESIESNIRYGNHLISIQEYQSPIKVFDIIIKSSNDPDLLSDAWNNKAVCSGVLGREKRRLQQINKALGYRIKPKFLSNKIIALEKLGRKTEAEKVRKQLTELQI
jgi:hypothetical protein